MESPFLRKRDFLFGKRNVYARKFLQSPTLIVLEIIFAPSPNLLYPRTIGEKFKHKITKPLQNRSKSRRRYVFPRKYGRGNNICVS
ncbi:hypothetical protein LEP1GSC171_2667 [Leptospira santarosai str. HAI1380]|nr:hypothetical protein LEP1GSC169_3409 [Leptospira santarosai str. HAI1349]EMO14934.1 hypothetical protein LEP1GSC165_2646 [Leptospira santarosai str. CBC523]EMP00646.1 hypothetical protein LEP1GSC171_2667 [Leptospira santarosai str. HAI1380]EMP83074.1 hypothetical protein LEP1GSC162_2686 [Leptospira santarosai str. CBC1531]